MKVIEVSRGLVIHILDKQHNDRSLCRRVFTSAQRNGQVINVKDGNLDQVTCSHCRRAAEARDYHGGDSEEDQRRCSSITTKAMCEKLLRFIAKPKDKQSIIRYVQSQYTGDVDAVMTRCRTNGSPVVRFTEGKKNKYTSKPNLEQIRAHLLRALSTACGYLSSAKTSIDAYFDYNFSCSRNAVAESIRRIRETFDRMLHEADEVR